MIGKVLLEKYCASLESGESQEFCSEEMDALNIGNNSITLNNVDVTDLGRKFHQRVSTIRLKALLLLCCSHSDKYKNTN